MGSSVAINANALVVEMDVHGKGIMLVAFQLWLPLMTMMVETEVMVGVEMVATKSTADLLEQMMIAKQLVSAVGKHAPGRLANGLVVVIVGGLATDTRIRE